MNVVERATFCLATSLTCTTGGGGVSGEGAFSHPAAMSSSVEATNHPLAGQRFASHSIVCFGVDFIRSLT